MEDFCISDFSFIFFIGESCKVALLSAIKSFVLINLQASSWSFDILRIDYAYRGGLEAMGSFAGTIAYMFIASDGVYY